MGKKKTEKTDIKDKVIYMSYLLKYIIYNLHN